MPLLHDRRLDADQLPALLAACGLHLGPDSPLVGLPPPGRLVPAAELEGAGLVPTEWEPALRVLTAPTAVLRVLQPLPDVVAVRSFYAGPGYADLVGCWPGSGAMRIGFPYTPVGQVHQSALMLTADFPGQIDPLRLDLSVDGLAALAAATDAVRGGVLASMLARGGGAYPLLEETDLERAYGEGLAGRDARWLVTLLHWLMPMSLPLPPRLSSAGIGELATQGLLVGAEGRWRATISLQRFAGWMLNPLPALAHELVTLPSGIPGAYRYLIGLRGCGPLWTLEFWQGDPPSVTLRSRSGSEYRRAVAWVTEPLEGDVGEIEPAPPPPPPPDR